MNENNVKKNLRVFISSTGDLVPDQSIVLDIINSLSQREESKKSIGFVVIKWPDGIAAGTSHYSQAVINRQTSDYDILICIIGTRIGTPTPRANSGTEEEFDRAIESILQGKPVQVLLFFNNLPLKPQSLDPNQLLLVQAFREKAIRLGVLFHTYDDHDVFRQQLKISLSEAHKLLTENLEKQQDWARLIKTSLLLNEELNPISFGNFIMKNRTTAPQRADKYLVNLAKYRRQNIRLTGNLKTSSTYFRFGFKYFNSREPLFSSGSVQTPGQNILFHIGKNEKNPTWFASSYKGGYRLDKDLPIEGTAGITRTRFAINISSVGNVEFELDTKVIYESFFPMDGIPNLAILAWSDEHDFECEVQDLTLNVRLERELEK